MMDDLERLREYLKTTEFLERLRENPEYSERLREALGRGPGQNPRKD
jgi:hypothetical protein